MKKIKRTLSLLLSVILFCSSLSLSSFASDAEVPLPEETTAEEKNYILTIGQPEHATIAISGENKVFQESEENKYYIASGETVIITMEVDDGYILESLLLDNEQLEVKEHTARFIMPEKDVSLSGIFKEQEKEPEKQPEVLPDYETDIEDPALTEKPEDTIKKKIHFFILQEGGQAKITDSAGKESELNYTQTGAADVLEFLDASTFQLDVTAEDTYWIDRITFCKDGNIVEIIDSSAVLNAEKAYKKEIKADGSVDEIKISFEKKIVLKGNPLERKMGIDMSSFSLSRTRTISGTPNVGDVVSGTCYIYESWMIGSQSYFNVGDYSGDLAGCYVVSTIECLDYTAAEPNHTVASYKATVTEVNTAAGYIEYSVYITPPGATDGVSRDENGNLYGYQHIGGLVRVPRQFVGWLDVYKSSAKPEITVGNSLYSLEGAEYGLYKDGALIKTVITDRNGYARFEEVEAGDYILKELNPPAGYALNAMEYPVTIHSGQATRADVQDFPQNDPIGMLLGKIDFHTNQNEPQGSGSLQDAQFTVKYYAGHYDTDPAQSGVSATRTWVFKTDADGFAACHSDYQIGGDSLYTNSRGTATLPLGTITIQETKAPTGYLINNEVYVRKITSDGRTESVHTYNMPKIPEKSVRGGVRIEKWDFQRDQREPQGNATLSGAELQIISQNPNPVVVDGKTYNQGEVVLTILTDLKGEAQTAKDALPYGDYRVKEENPPEGYNNTGIIERYFSIREEGVIVNLNTTDTAIKNNVIRGGVEIEKWDKEKNQRKAQGSASLAGAQFQLISLNDHPVLVAGSWYQKQDVITTLTTDEKGKTKTEATYLPYGTYKCKEIIPPTGYNAAGILEREFTIKKEGEMVKLNTADTAIKNDVIRGDLQLVKFKEDQDEEEDQKTPLEGIIFSITSKTTGDMFEIVTDEHGYASTKQLQISERGNLVYDTYIVHEETKREGLKPVKDFEITIANEGETLYYILEDKLIVAPVRLEKVDSTTGKVIPMANAEFALLDEDKNPITMTTHYPNETVHKTFKTDESGTFTLPEKLKVGTYYWRELQAPNGYLQGQDLQFQIKEGHSWESPFVVRYEDTPVMGKITLHKTDKETGEAIAGTRFEVRAAEDIATGDGTIRLTKGQLAQELVTDEMGNAQTDPMFLGTYTVKEAAQTEGFVLSDTEHKVKLSYKDQNTELVVESLSVTNVRTKVKVIKVDEETKEPLAGVSFQVWNKEMGKETDEEMAAQIQYTTDKHGVIVLQYLAPGTYCFQEVETLPGYVLNEQIFEVVVSADGRIDGKEMGVLEVENVPTKLIGTKAKDKDTGTQEAVSKKVTTFVDTVEFKNLQIGETYVIKGILMDKSTGKPLFIQGKEVTAEKTFVAEEADGTQDVEFVFDATELKGKEIVVFETVYTRGVKIAAHEDLKDQGQTIQFPEHNIKTTARDKETGAQEAIAKKQTTIVDCVEYTGLIPKLTYTVRGTLMDKSNGKELMIDGKPVTAEKTLIPEKSEGSVELSFTFDSSELNGTSVVVFERLYVEDIEVAAHTDLNDEKQTVKVRIGKLITKMPNQQSNRMFSPKTGDTTKMELAVWILALTACVTVAGVTIYKRRRKQDEE